jgi:hypothetical protein
VLNELCLDVLVADGALVVRQQAVSLAEKADAAQELGQLRTRNGYLESNLLIVFDRYGFL